MKTFTIHEPPEPPRERFDRADSLIFVKDGFSWPGLFFAPIWLPLNGLWIAFVGYILVACAIIGIAKLLGLEEQIIAPGFAILHLLVGFEYDNLQRWALRRSGWHELGAVTGRSQTECERNFFDAWLPDQPHITPDSSGSSLGERVV